MRIELVSFFSWGLCKSKRIVLTLVPTLTKWEHGKCYFHFISKAGDGGYQWDLGSGSGTIKESRTGRKWAGYFIA